MSRQAKKGKDDWDQLYALIANFGQASRADEMRGGGDPADFELIEAELELARLKLVSHIRVMKEKYT